MPAIKFKFRSSLNFESLDIGDRASISVGELKSKIEQHMKLNVFPDSCLVFSDAVSGQEYKNESAEIQSGSCVIIKRVPAVVASYTVKSINSVEDALLKSTKQNNLPLPACKGNDLSELPFLEQLEAMDFDDFGEDLCAFPKKMLSGPVFQVEKQASDISQKPNIEFDHLRDVACHDGHTMEGHKKDQNDLTEYFLGDNLMQAGSGLEYKDHPKLKLEKLIGTDPCSIQNIELPSYIKCPLCYSVFKDAMMIPCCQHSFCEKCIRSMLTQKGMCPKCLSARCRENDLLPNLSLRKTVENLLELQSFTAGGTENAYCQSASDRESGIHVQDFCGRESNHIVGESTRFTRLGKKGSFKGDNGSCVNIHNKKHEMMLSDFQGENHPVMEQGDSTTKKNKKKGLLVSTSGEDVKVMESGAFRKGQQACYMCGSLDHLIRGCPVALSRDPTFHRGNLVFPGAMPGFRPPFWNGNPSPYMSQFPEQYTYFGTWHFGAGCVPSPAFNTPMYMDLSHNGFPHYGMTSLYGSNGGLEPNYGELKIFEDHGHNPKIRSDKFERESSYDERDAYDFGRKYQYAEISHGAYDGRSHMGKERSGHSSDESFDPKYLRRRHRRKRSESDEHLLDERHNKTHHRSFSDRIRGSRHHQRKLHPEVEEDLHTQSSSGKRGEEIHCYRYENHKKDKEIRGRSDSGSSFKGKTAKRKGETINANKKIDHYHRVERLDHNDPKRKIKNRNYSPNFVHNRYSSDSMNEENSLNEELILDRWKMMSGSSEYTGGGHQQSHKKQYRAY
ncbi:hypothetical protein SAY86_011697 [Trapa natans]|uniref:Uncharacterized protein n=1 Tax=Trapa natans TaxID=22666 RepID=A0AAN7R0W2_TRANT|nr:hypothetical protein SAY86_011697 [Trapa natans]